VPPLPAVSGDQAVAAFARLGWVLARRESSHMTMKKSGVFAALSIPDKCKVADGTLRTLIRIAGLSVDEFVAALKKS
jgi:predicted RNA binding protein YcfA (HicA-like mRNA interferase family)